MSLSEKLWQASASRDEEALFRALPEIIAVVEAAEHYLREHTQGRPALTLGIEQSLAALEAKLAGKE